ncbi:MAG TPA: alpha/beta fold hydrolase [Solirubrobacteraceae bacterium]|jgi:alpha-beta hydrolase superfamily lysophospholipase|nr:alpha/beta fold hydrolase [Solirubrobacteraceae bacterium]
MSAPRAFYLRPLHPSHGAAFAVLHTPVLAPRPTAILLCPPFGWEDMCSYRIRRQWAEQLARDGHTTLRIDLPGSGDSAGAPGDPGQLDAWTEAIAGAARWLRHAQGAQRVAAVGIGLGGLVATRAALRGAPIDELALWAVPVRGRTLLRELRAFSAFEVANHPGTGDGEVRQSEPAPCKPVAADDGTLAANGYMLSADTVSELGRLDLARLEPSGTQLRRALVLGRDGMKVADALPDALRSAGAEVMVADGPGYGALMVEPQDALTPIEVIERVGSWLREGEEEEGGEGATFKTPTTLQTKAGWGPKSKQQHMPSSPNGTLAGEIEVPLDSDELEIECAGVTLRERPLLLDGPDGPLFGVLAEPLGERRRLTAVLLNAGPQRRTGPNRMWVEIARRWAAQGVPSLRLDCAGIGDSDGDSTVLARVAEFYRPAYAEQARAALTALAARGLPPRFVMVGLCAGGYWSVQAALADERVAAVAMLNPRTLVFDEWRHAQRRTGHLRSQALRASTWRRLLRGEIKFAKHLETGRTLVRRAASAPARARKRIAVPRRADENTAGDPIEALFDALRDRHQRGLLLFTGSEILRRELTERGVLERIDRWPNLRLALMGTDVDTHTLTPVWLQLQVHALLDGFLEEQLAGLPDEAGDLAVRQVEA